MKTSIKKCILLSFLLALSGLSACSDDKPEIRFDHPHTNVSNLEKHRFEHEFAAKCVSRELKNSANPKQDKKRFTKPCLCIATRVMKNLTTVEAEKFLVEKKHTQSLKMSFDEAAYFCLQQTAQPKSPVLFGKQGQ